MRYDSRMSQLKGLLSNPQYLGCCVAAMTCLSAALAFAQCRQAQFKGHINGGETFNQALGSDLEFEIWPKGDSGGWQFRVSPHGFTADWAHVVTPPLSGDNSQRLDNGYGETVRYELGYPHEIRFVLNKSDYDHMKKLVDEALSPHTGGDSNEPLSAYLEALAKVATGLAVLMPIDYDKLGPSDQASWMDFQVTVTVPKSFATTEEVNWMDTACPAPPR